MSIGRYRLCRYEMGIRDRHITYSEMKKEIRVQLMGEVQMEILKYTIAQRLGLSVTFDEGMVNYKETIEQEVEEMCIRDSTHPMSCLQKDKETLPCQINPC